MARDNPKPEDGWIEWSGGKCPVERFRHVQVRHRDGWEDGPHGRPAGCWVWAPKLDRPTNIIAYRVVRP